MRKICLLIIALVCVSGFSILLIAEGPNKLDQLKKKRADILTQMNNRRMKLIEEDLKLKEIHDKIMALHKELAIKLDSDSEISKFANQIRDIDSDIDSLSEKSKKDEGKEENKANQITQ